LKFVAERAVVAAFQTAIAPLAFARSDQMLEAARCLNGRFAAFSATLIALHPKLILALPRNRQMGELVFNASSHGRTHSDRTSLLCESSISTTETSMISLGTNPPNCQPSVSA
jgi:hypothetical protein